MINGKIIAIDARMIEMSGIGRYIQNLMGKKIYDYAFGIEAEIRKYDQDVKVIPFNKKIYSIGEQTGFPNRQVKNYKIDLVHFPHYNVPLSYHGKFVVTVHDLTHVILPGFLGNKMKRYYAELLMKNALQKSVSVFTVSQNSKRDICSIFGIDEEKVSVTYNAVDKEFLENPGIEKKCVYEKFGIPQNKKLVLYVGNLKPHKNLARLLLAFSKLKDSDNIRLLLVGKAFTGIGLDDQEKALGIAGKVIHTGIVSNEELICLYNCADLFVFPSLYEGFGIPPLEAMACGTPVVCSNNSSLPEVVGDAALMFDPYNIDEIKDSMQKMLGDRACREKYIELGKIRCRKFSWDDTVETVRKTIGRVCI